MLMIFLKLVLVAAGLALAVVLTGLICGAAIVFDAMREDAERYRKERLEQGK